MIRSRNPVDPYLEHQIRFASSGANVHDIVNWGSAYMMAERYADEKRAKGEEPDPGIIQTAKIYEDVLRKLFSKQITPAQGRRMIENAYNKGVNPMPQLTIASNPGRRSRRTGRRGRKARVAKIMWRGKPTSFIAIYAKVGRKASAIWRKARRRSRR